MKILIVGLGSMGRRRLRLLQRYFPFIEVAGVDAQQERCEAVGVPTYREIAAAIDDFQPNAALICSSPLAHAEQIKMCLRHGLHVFTEINLVKDGYQGNRMLAQKMGRTLFLSSTYLYRNEIKAIQEAVSASHAFKLYTYHVGQYLPDWHPWESYKNYFLGDKRTNGCREILAINLPWLVKTFGEIEAVYSVSGKMSELQIDYPDSYVITLRHHNGNIGVFTVDLISREAVCNLRVQSEDLLMTWNGQPNGLHRFDPKNKSWQEIDAYDQSKIDHMTGYTANIIENAYLAELEDFFAQIQGDSDARYTFAEDEKVLDWIDEIETHCQSGEGKGAKSI